MASLELKEYQRDSLEAIGRFCDAVYQRVGVAERPVHDAYYAETHRDFIEVPQLPGVPYVCLRVPTGGGKTLLAAHSVGVMGRRLGRQDRPLCLWVTPSTTIRDQTFNRLLDRHDPYHAALREGLNNAPVEVMRMEDALRLNRSLLTSSAVVIVTTIQSYRIDDPSNRKVYEDNGYLMDNFTNVPSWVRDDLAEDETGKVRLSLANVMKRRGPIVIMDEAHNARTRISFDSLARFGPLGVLELTATPQQDHDAAREMYASNVLHAVSALQLAREGMIKLPVELESRDNWLDVLSATVAQRHALEETARAWERESKRFIRPIALIQAQSKSKARETHTVEAIHKALMEQLHVPPERIRIATGQHDNLGDEDLHARDCTVEYVLTVEKLRQGWDCPFAYVLGSVGNVATETAVEQLLGRVLRMPDALPTGVPDLDRAYAIVQSPDVVKTAKSLCDSLVRYCGFDADSVSDAFRVRRRDEQGRLPVSVIPVSEAPSAETLPPAIRDKVQYDEGSNTLHVREPLTREEAVALRDSLPTLTDRAAVEEYWQSERAVGTAAKRLDEYAVPLRIPQLAVREGKRCWLFEPEELDEFSWNLDKCDPRLSEGDFSVDLNVGDRVALGVTEGGAVRVLSGVEQVLVRQLTVWADNDDWSKVRLVRWLDRELHHGGAFAGLTQAEGQAWLARVLDSLLAERGADLSILVRKRHELADATIRRVAAHGRVQVREAAEMLFDAQGKRRLETSMNVPFKLEEHDYRPNHQYHGPLDFQNHAFDLKGDMNGEEAECASRIDRHPNVKRWLRNLEYESAGGFNLPLSPGRFFPDFIAELCDGRIAIVEYKGAYIADSDKERHKETVGKLWAERSDGQCVFVRVVERDWAVLEATLHATA